MVSINALRQRKSDIDLQSQTASAVEAQRIAPSDQKLDAKRLKLAEHVGLWSLMPYVIVLTAVQAVLRAYLYQTRFCGTWYDESAALDESISQVRTARAQHSLGHLPLVVITHGKDLDASWQALQNDLASLSSNSTHLIATGSGHAIMFDQPDLVVAAIKQVVTG